MSDSFTDPIGQRIYESFGPTHNQWRSLGGIQRYSGLPHDQVLSYINQHADSFIQSPICPSGIPLYRPNLEGVGIR